MDRIIPSLEHADRHGLPSYPEPLERMVKDLADMPVYMLTPEELQLMNAWVRARTEPIRKAKQRNPENQDRVFRELGWPTRRSGKD